MLRTTIVVIALNRPRTGAWRQIAAAVPTFDDVLDLAIFVLKKFEMSKHAFAHDMQFVQPNLAKTDREKKSLPANHLPEIFDVFCMKAFAQTLHLL